MSLLFNCALMCALISVWGALQLGVMSVLYYTESVNLIEDCEEHHADSYDDFIEKTKKNYAATSINCMIAAAIYVGSLLISTICILRAKKKDRLKAARLLDDELSCQQEAGKPEVVVKAAKPQSPGLLSRLMKKKKDKPPEAPPPATTEYKPSGKIDIKDSNELEEKRKALEEEEKKKNEKNEKNEKKEKRKKDRDSEGKGGEGREGKKKKKRDKDK